MFSPYRQDTGRIIPKKPCLPHVSGAHENIQSNVFWTVGYSSHSRRKDIRTPPPREIPLRPHHVQIPDSEFFRSDILLPNHILLPASTLTGYPHLRRLPAHLEHPPSGGYGIFLHGLSDRIPDPRKRNTISRYDRTRMAFGARLLSTVQRSDPDFLRMAQRRFQRFRKYRSQPVLRRTFSRVHEPLRMGHPIPRVESLKPDQSRYRITMGIRLCQASSLHLEKSRLVDHGSSLHSRSLLSESRFPSVDIQRHDRKPDSRYQSDGMERYLLYPRAHGRTTPLT